MNSQTALTGLIGPVGPDGRGTGESGTDAFAGLSIGGERRTAGRSGLLYHSTKEAAVAEHFRSAGDFPAFYPLRGESRRKEAYVRSDRSSGKKLSLPRVCACARVSPAPA